MGILSEADIESDIFDTICDFIPFDEYGKLHSIILKHLNRMKELADERGIKEGIMTMPWPTRAHVISEEGRYCNWVPWERMVKVRVLDLTGEFTTMAPRMANQTLYHGFDSTILNKGSKRNKSFIQRNIDLYIKTI